MELSKVTEEAIDPLVQYMARDFKHIDAANIIRGLMSSSLDDLLGAYAESLNIAADLRGKGYSYSSPEYEDAEKLIQKCEHSVAQHVLKKNGWDDISVKMYYKKGK